MIPLQGKQSHGHGRPPQASALHLGDPTSISHFTGTPERRDPSREGAMVLVLTNPCPCQGKPGCLREGGAGTAGQTGAAGHMTGAGSRRKGEFLTLGSLWEDLSGLEDTFDSVPSPGQLRINIKAANVAPSRASVSPQVRVSVIRSQRRTSVR